MFLDAPFHCLESLYRWCNYRYFDGTLPCAQISWNARLKNTYGFFEWVSEPDKSGPRIVISERVKGCHYELLDTIVHEMIHVWQYQKYVTTKDTRFLDIRPERGHAFHSSWHGKYFYQWVSRLNAGFEELNLAPEKEGFPTDIGLVVDEKHAVHIRFSIGGVPEEALFMADHGLENHLETLVSDAMDVFGPDSLQSVSVSKTQCPDVQLFPKLKRCGRFRVNQSIQSHDPELVDRVLSHHLTELPDVIYVSGDTVSARDFNQTNALALSDNALAMPLFLLFGHVSSKFACFDASTDACLKLAGHRWFDFPIQSALETPNGRGLIRTMARALGNGDTSSLSAFTRLWHSLGPGRYDPGSLLESLVQSNALREVCAQSFLSSNAILSRLNTIEIDYILSTFHHAKKAANDFRHRVRPDHSESILKHYGIPSQKMHLNILRGIIEDKSEFQRYCS